MVSVSDAGEGGALQVWRICDLIWRPIDEVLKELEEHRWAAFSPNGRADPQRCSDTSWCSVALSLLATNDITLCVHMCAFCHAASAGSIRFCWQQLLLLTALVGDTAAVSPTTVQTSSYQSGQR